MKSLVRNPVAQIRQSSSWVRPSEVRTPSGDDRLDVRRLELDVRPFQRRQEVRAEQHPLAAERVVRPDLLAQRGVFDLGADERRRARRADPSGAARVTDQQRQELAVLEHEPAAERLQPGHPFVGGPDRRGVGTVLARQEPVPGPLEDRHAADPRGDLGHELDRAGARADDADALAGEVVVVVPFGRVEAVARELAGALRSSGTCGWCSWPVASTSASASKRSPSEVSTVQVIGRPRPTRRR